MRSCRDGRPSILVGMGDYLKEGEKMSILTDEFCSFHRSIEKDAITELVDQSVSVVISSFEETQKLKKRSSNKNMFASSGHRMCDFSSLFRSFFLKRN